MNFRKFLQLFHPGMVFSRAIPALARKKGSKIINISLKFEQDCLLDPVSQF